MKNKVEIIIEYGTEDLKEILSKKIQQKFLEILNEE